MYITVLKVPIDWMCASGVFAHFSEITLSNPLQVKNTNFQSCSNAKTNGTNEKIQKNDRENGMVYFVWMCGSRDIMVSKPGKMTKNADSAFFCDFQTMICSEAYIQTQ